MQDMPFDTLCAQMRAIHPTCSVGRVTALGRDHVAVSGLDRVAALGDRVRIGEDLMGEVLRLGDGGGTIMPEGSPDGVRLGMPVTHVGPATLAPHDGWLGRVIDPDGRPMDGRPLFPGPVARPLMAPPPPPADRRGFGPRLATGFCRFRHAPAHRARSADRAVRGLGRGQVTPDRRAGAGDGRRCRRDRPDRRARARGARFPSRDAGARGAGAVGRHRGDLGPARADAGPRGLGDDDGGRVFPRPGRQVLLLADSITRFAEAQREIAAAAGEPFGPSGFPASDGADGDGAGGAGRAGATGQGDITAVLSVLVAGSDMEGRWPT